MDNTLTLLSSSWCWTTSSLVSVYNNKDISHFNSSLFFGMVLPGGEVPIERKKKKKVKASGIASKRLETQVERELRASQALISAIVNPPVNQPTKQQAEDRDDREEVHYDHLIQADGDDPAEPRDDEAEHRLNSRTDYYKSVTYQERSLREEANWQAVLPKLFLAFMPCSYKTHQWCDIAAWNHDFNVACKCRDWQKRTIEVDVIDLTCKTTFFWTL